MAEKRSNETLTEDTVTPIPKKIKNDVITNILVSETCESIEPTSLPSTLPKNDAAFDLELCRLDHYEIIWFNSDVDNPIKLNRLRKISDYVKFFDNIENCRDYIEIVATASDKSALFLVSSGPLAKKLVLAVHHLNAISSIHCLINAYSEEEWMTNDPKIKIHVALQPLLKSLLQNVDHYSKDHENQNIFDLTRNTTEQENTTDNIESWWPKLVYIIVHLPYPQDCFQRFLAIMRKYYSTNPSELRHIDQLELNYLSTTNRNPIQEYTKDTFLYRMVNRVLRQKNIQFMFLFAFFLRDLFQQLKREHENFLRKQLKNSKVTVYRGQIMAKTEIEKLKGSTGNMVTSSFMSTTFDPAMSEIYLGTSMPDDELQSILFEIELNLAEKSFPYADISTISWFPSESETLLMPGLEFKMTENSIYYDLERKIWLAKLELVSDTIEKVEDRMLEGFGERRKMRYYIDLLMETLTEFCSATAALIETVFNQLMQLFPREKWILAVKMSCLAQYNIDRDFNYTLALPNWDEALKYWLEYQDDEELNADIAIGRIYYDIGTIYYFHIKHTGKSRENFDLSIKHYQIAIKKGLTSSEQINIYEYLHEMYGKKFLISAIETDTHTDDDEMKEIQSMIIKYLELQLESMLKCYDINNKRISIAVEQLTGYYDQFDMYDEELCLSKKLLELYRKDSSEKNSEKIVALLKRIIAIYFVHKDDQEAAMMYQSQLEERITGNDTQAADDFIIDYRQNEGEEVDPDDAEQPMRRWSTTD
ncbi:unnamed protein product [Rotaria socialis]|uniref:ADP ribosyltransferase domain-containing protein n=1 Tax=Rotaria socialis TaxID=392032 RepID=A0A818CQV6_9BILA|nr:unnamed protein product [Rotaria socialis]CAF4748426.1 unnamed protein product [Rotaria socialis]